MYHQQEAIFRGHLNKLVNQQWQSYSGDAVKVIELRPPDTLFFQNNQVNFHLSI